MNTGAGATLQGMKRLAVVFALATTITACGGGDDPAAESLPDSDPAPSVVDETADTTVAGDGVDTCGQGQAFPDDPDFREAICRPMAAMVDLIGTDAEMDPTWSARIAEATMLYADDRSAAMAELQAILAEIEAAAAAAG